VTARSAVVLAIARLLQVDITLNLPPIDRLADYRAMDPFTWVATSEAARILGVDRSTVTRRVDSGVMKPVMTLPTKTGSHLFVLRDVLALIDSAGGSRGDAGAPVSGAAPVVTLPDPGDGGGSSVSAA
jgi:hypothetical protein